MSEQCEECGGPVWYDADWDFQVAVCHDCNHRQDANVNILTIPHPAECI
jgi:hypothetical protein